MNTIEHEWQQFAGAIFEGMSPSPTQYQETRRAFFAGALTLFSALQEIGQPHIDEVEANVYLSDRAAECRQFGQQLLKDITAPPALRELADRLEQRTTIKR